MEEASREVEEGEEHWCGLALVLVQIIGPLLKLGDLPVSFIIHI